MIHGLTNKAHLSANTVINISQRFYLQRWWQKSNGIDMEQNYVTVILCIQLFTMVFNCGSLVPHSRVLFLHHCNMYAYHYLV